MQIEPFDFEVVAGYNQRLAISSLHSSLPISNTLYCGPDNNEFATPAKIHQTNSTSTIFISRYDELFRKTGLTVLPGIQDGQTNQKF